MKQLTAYIIAKKMLPEQDVIILETNVVYFNLSDARETAQGKHIFKLLLPHPQDGTGIIVESDADMFEQFYQAYPRKVGKKNALKSWTRIKVTPELFTKIMTALEIVKKTNQWQDIQYVPHPATWLNQERWEDEVETPRSKPLPASDSKYEGI